MKINQPIMTSYIGSLKAWIGGMLLALAMITWTIVTTAMSFQESHSKGGWKPPEIQQCDKPLLERITDGC